MIVAAADSSIERKVLGDFQFPLGVYPVESMTPKPGYTLQFEPADGGEESEPGGEGEWEEWPDRYVFDAVVSAQRVESLVHALLALMPSRVYPILDVLGQDAYREIDPYISYDLIGLDQVLDDLCRYRDFFFEDGLVGFGVMSEEPFYYIFVDEHKIVTIRAEPTMKERVEKVLHAFGLEETPEPAGADAAAHEHRGVLSSPPDRPDLLSLDEVVERLRDRWTLVLNIDPDSNLDDSGRDLGETPWRCVVRCAWPDKPPRYAEVLLTAESLRSAEETALDAAEELAGPTAADLDDCVVISADRLRSEDFEKVAPPARKKGTQSPGGKARGSKGGGRLGAEASSPPGEPADDPELDGPPEPLRGEIRGARWMES